MSWIPKKLGSLTYYVVKGTHEKHGYGNLPGILWHKETTVMIGCHDDLRALLAAGTYGVWLRRTSRV